MKKFLASVAVVAALSGCASSPTLTAAVAHKVAAAGCLASQEAIVSAGERGEITPEQTRIAYEADKAACAITLTELQARSEAEAAKAED